MVVAILASMMFVTFLVVSTSRAAFTATTENTANSVASGSVLLSDDDLDVALFAVSGMAPLDSAERCIEVRYDGTLSAGSPVRIYAPSAPTGTGLDQYLTMTVERGTSATFGDCSTFAPASVLYTGSALDAFSGTHDSWANGLSTGWTPTAAGQTTSYRVTLTLQDNNSAQDLTTGFGLTWEVQS